MVSQAWNSFTGSGPPDEALAAKLRIIKNAIKNWRRKEYEKEMKMFDGSKRRVLELDSNAESRNLSEAKISEWHEGKKKLIEMEDIRRLDLKQKSKVKWTVEGDEIANFFMP
uniref:RNA-directed DNA polymerase, eukaryota, reverse transcriptase zinc-binding domain protein n=1 Tax=Lactuca sativa TaxID=4236 RepID=A0A9R1W4M2_LACSA|nr:hypothetical protein LSAT_V11C300121630 [Lactuca sativa]